MDHLQARIVFAGASGFASAETGDGRKITIAQADGEPRLAIDDEILVPAQVRQPVRSWEWADPTRRAESNRRKATEQEKVAHNEAMEEQERRSLVARYEKAIAPAMSALTPPENPKDWEETFERMAKLVPPDVDLDRVALAAMKFADAVSELIYWAEEHGVSLPRIDGCVERNFPDWTVHGARLADRTPADTFRSAVESLRSAAVPNADPTLRVLEQFRDQWRLRSAFSLTVPVWLEPAWADADPDLMERLGLPPQRYYIVASAVDDPVHWAIDSTDEAGSLCRLSLQDGGSVERQGSFRTLIQYWLRFQKECAGSDAEPQELMAWARLEAWVAANEG